MIILSTSMQSKKLIILNILDILRNKKYKSITIAPKEGGKSTLIECTADYKEGDTLPDYGDIVTRVQDGSIVQKTIKERIKVK